MRSGKILVEDCPRRLMSIHNMPNLEEVFLQLCIEDENNKTSRVGSVNRYTNSYFKSFLFFFNLVILLSHSGVESSLREC